MREVNFFVMNFSVHAPIMIFIFNLDIYGAPPPPGMLIVLVLLATVLITGISLCALLVSKVKKKKNNDGQVPLIMDLDGKQNIMPYCDEGRCIKNAIIISITETF